MAVSPAALGPALPEAEPPAPHLAANFRLNRWHAVAAAVSLSAIQPFIGVLAIRLGANDAELGTLSSLPNLLSIPAVLLGAWFLVRARRKQFGVAVALLLSRLTYLAVAAVPWAPPAVRVPALLAVWALAMGPDAAGRTGLNSLIADLFPGRHRGRALGDRNVAATAAGMVAGLATGVLLDRLPYPAGYQAMFTLASVVGLVEVALVMAMGEASAATAPTAVAGGTARWLDTLRHGPYVRYTLAALAFHLSWQVAWPAFARFQVTEMGANNTWVSILSVASSIGSILAYPQWARLERHYGNRRPLIVAISGLALTPALNVLSPTLPVLIPVNVFTGVMVAGVVLLLLNGLLGVTPADERPLYLAVNQALVSATGAVAPLLGGVMMAGLGTRSALWLFTGVRLLLGVGSFWWLDRREGRQENAA